MPLHKLSTSLWHWAAVSSLWLTLSVSNAAAHEVVPTIADLTVEAGQVTMILQVNIEAQLSGIDLDAVQDTDTADNAADYDVLRALSGDAVANRVPDLAARWNAVPLVDMGGAVALTVQSVTVPEVPNAELPRISEVVMFGAAPEGIGSVEVAWPAGAGDLVLRQQGVSEPYTGLISGGGSSGPIAVSDAAGGSWWRSLMDYVLGRG
ncbi:hypothetical protein [Tateyamaria sp. SN6-1]|uniref:hypothetical protein n=1 Tax=Tateyamaria sp. SN6-1 TaxID=3092148 RepID=UPI0039F4BDC9